METFMTISLLFTLWQAPVLPVHGTPLDHGILHYEPLDYSKSDLLARHQRVLRAEEDVLTFTFQALGKLFEIHLVPEEDLFSPTHHLEYSDGTLQAVGTSHFYTGVVQGVEASHVHLSVLDGQAQGYVTFPGDTTYYIEPAARFFPNSTRHSILYDCRHLNWMPYGRKESRVKIQGHTPLEDSSKPVLEQSIGVAMMMSDADDRHISPESRTEASDIRGRQVTVAQHHVCNLHMVADPTFWSHFKRQRFHRTLTDDETSNEILAFFASHVSELKRIFRTTVFQTYDGSESWSGVDFTVDRSTVMTELSERCGTPRASPFCDVNMTSVEFAKNISSANHNDFCLAAFFSNRNFSKMLGLAMQGSPTSALGGICDRYRKYADGTFSGNTLYVTIFDRARTLPRRLSKYVFVHEIGHSFGSPHDSGRDCAPGEESSGGNYIMYGKAPLSYKKRNDGFSACSKDNISRLLSAVARRKNGRYNCLTMKYHGSSLLEDFHPITFYIKCGVTIACGWLSYVYSLQ